MTWEFWMNAVVATGVVLSLLGVGWLTSHAAQMRRIVERLSQDAFETGEHVASLNKQALPLVGSVDKDSARLTALEGAITRIDETLRVAFAQISNDVASLRRAGAERAQVLTEQKGDTDFDIKTIYGKLDALNMKVGNLAQAADKLRADHNAETGAANKWRASVAEFLTRKEGFATNESLGTVAKMLTAIEQEIKKINERAVLQGTQITDLGNHASSVNGKLTLGYERLSGLETELADTDGNIARIVLRLNEMASKEAVDASLDAVMGRIEALEALDRSQELSTVHLTADEALKRTHVAVAKADDAVKSLTPLSDRIEDTRQQLGAAVDKIAQQVARLAATQQAMTAPPVTETAAA